MSETREGAFEVLSRVVITYGADRSYAALEEALLFPVVPILAQPQVHVQQITSLGSKAKRTFLDKLHFLLNQNQQDWKKIKNLLKTLRMK